MTKRFIRCKICGQPISQVKLLRKWGYCKKHLPEILSCPVITQRGIRCNNPKQSSEDIICNLHKRFIPKEETKRLDHEEFKAKYENYLQSDEWKAKVVECKKRFMFRCAVCNRGNYLVVHHRTYNTIFDEHQKDLTLLCNECHSLFHENYEITFGRFIPKNDQKSKFHL